jgi:hypothetical protein
LPSLAAICESQSALLCTTITLPPAILSCFELRLVVEESNWIDDDDGSGSVFKSQWVLRYRGRTAAACKLATGWLYSHRNIINTRCVNCAERRGGTKVTCSHVGGPPKPAGRACVWRLLG